MSSRHDWNSWQAYLVAHTSFLRGWEHFVIRDSLRWSQTSTLIEWKGVPICLDGYEIYVDKEQYVEHRAGRAYVKTFHYSYEVLRRVEGVARQVFRYDNTHPHQDHPDAHHRHRYDKDGRELLPREHVGEARWPTLGDVIIETYGMWNQMKLDEE